MVSNKVLREFPFDLFQLDFLNKITAKVLDPIKSPNEWLAILS